MHNYITVQGHIQMEFSMEAMNFLLEYLKFEGG